MDKNQEFYFNQFKKMFSELDGDKQKMLHDYLGKMSSEERLKHAIELGKRYYQQQRGNQNLNSNPTKVNKPQVQTNRPQQVVTPVKTNNVNTNSVNQPRQVVKPVDAARQVNSNNPNLRQNQVNNQTKTKTKVVKRGYLRAILVAICATLFILCGVKLFDMFLKDKDTEATTEVSATVIETTETLVETSATEIIETTPEATPTPTPTDIPTPSPVPLFDTAPDLTGKVIVIDPGHQEVADTTEENCASWLSITKPRCTSGTVGKATGITEYEYTLEFSMVLKSYLEQCGATVYLTRETNDVNMSNQERAQFAVDLNPDLYLRIHADGANDSLESGVRVYVPDHGSYTDTSVNNGNNLGKAVAEAFGIEFDSTLQTYLYTGLNYANTVRSFQISLGFLTNSDDEAALLNEDNQVLAAHAIAEFAKDF